MRNRLRLPCPITDNNERGPAREKNTSFQRNRCVYSFDCSVGLFSILVHFLAQPGPQRVTNMPAAPGTALPNNTRSKHRPVCQLQISALCTGARCRACSCAYPLVPKICPNAGKTHSNGVRQRAIPRRNMWYCCSV